MPVFGVPPRHRQLSRLGFYLGVALVLWLMGEAPPPESAWGDSDEALGVAPAYIASPVAPGGEAAWLLQ